MFDIILLVILMGVLIYHRHLIKKYRNEVWMAKTNLDIYRLTVASNKRDAMRIREMARHLLNDGMKTFAQEVDVQLILTRADKIEGNNYAEDQP